MKLGEGNCGLNETHINARKIKYLSDTFSVKNDLKIGHACSLMTFNFAVEYVIREVKANQEGLKLNATYHTFVYADGVNVLGNYV